MTQKALQTLEEKTTKFQEGLQAGQWRDADFLLKEATRLEASDLALAHRLLQRVRLLRPDNAVIIKREYELSKKLTLDTPELMTSSSTETTHSAVNGSLKNTNMHKIKNKLLQPSRFKSPFWLLVVFPILCFAFYEMLWASSRYESQTQLIIKQPDSASTLDPQLALLAGFSGGGSSGSDTELVKAYIYSNDMYLYLREKIQLDEHFSSKEYDIFSRLSESASIEDQLAFYKNFVKVEIDSKSSIVSIYSQGFSADFALILTQAIVERAEWYINEVGHRLAKEQLLFVQHEHKLVEQKLQDKKKALLAFQRRYNLLNPEAEGLALQQITYQLEGQIAVKKAELRTLTSSMSDNAPLVLQATEQLDSLNAQLFDERKRLTRTSVVGASGNHSELSIEASNQDATIGVNEVMSKFTDYKMDMEFSLQAYAASQISLEKSRIEAYRQLKFLMVVETPTLAQEAKYPRVLYNITLLATLLLLLFGIGNIIVATIKELR